jgi:DsbC/DsbD-like thiol-disulfide interchange protein
MIRKIAYAAALAVAPAAFAEEMPDTLAELEILPGWELQNGNLMVGFRFTLAPGWMTYWRAPGDGGFPPLFGWTGSQNVAAVRFHWPVPEVFDQSGMRSIGYSDQLILPVEIIRDEAGPLTHLAGQVEIGVCQNVCVPLQLTFDAALPEDSYRHPAIVAALIDRPMTSTEASVGSVRCDLAPSGRGMEISVSLSMPTLGSDEEVVIEAGDPQIWVSEPEVQRSGGALLARAELIHMDGDGLAIDRSDMRITVLADGRAVDIQGCTG